MKNSVITSLMLITLALFMSLSSAQNKLEEFLKLFDYTYDDIVVEEGINWVEKYYIK